MTLATIATRIAGTAAITENSPTMRTCRRDRGPAPPARLHQQPDFAADDADAAAAPRRVDEQTGDDHHVGRRDRRQVGEHEECGKRRQQRQRRRRRPKTMLPKRQRRRAGYRGIGRCSLFDGGHASFPGGDFCCWSRLASGIR